MTINNSTGVVTWSSPVYSETPYRISIAAVKSIVSTTRSFSLFVNISYTASVEVAQSSAVLGNNVTVTVTAFFTPGAPRRTVVVRVWWSNNGVRLYTDVTIEYFETTEHAMQLQNEETKRKFRLQDSTTSATMNIAPPQAGTLDIYATNPAVSAVQPSQSALIVYAIDTFPSSQYVTVIAGQPTNTTIFVRNQGAAVTGLSATLLTSLSAPLLGFTVSFTPVDIPVLQSSATVITILTSNTVALGTTAFRVVRIQFNTTQLATKILTLFITVVPPTPKLVASPEGLAAIATQDSMLILQFTVSNTGSATATNLQINVPTVFRFMTVSSPIGGFVSSLAAGSSVIVTLSLLPVVNDTGKLYTGTVAVSFDQGLLGVSTQVSVVPFGSGYLRVRIEDELTFTGVGNPLVQGATVEVVDLLRGSVIIASGVTNSTGFIEVDPIPAGSYLVRASAAGHASASSTVTVALGQHQDISVFLSRISVTYTFVVVPVAIEVAYAITITAQFETNVPIPVVTISPSVINIDQLIADDVQQIVFNITNHGLLAALNVRLDLPNSCAFSLSPLSFVNPIGDLPPQSSFIIPVRVLINTGCNDLCSLYGFQHHDFICGGVFRTYTTGISFIYSGFVECSGTPYSIGNGGGGSGSGGGAISTFSSIANCDPCPGIANSIANCVLQYPIPENCALTPTGAFSAATSIVSCGSGYFTMLCIDEITGCYGATASYATFKGSVTIARNSLPRACYEVQHLLFANVTWFRFNDSAWVDRFSLAASSSSSAGSIITEDEVTTFQLLTSSSDIISSNDLATFIQRWNNSMNYWPNGIYRIEDLPEGYSNNFIPLYGNPGFQNLTEECNNQTASHQSQGYLTMFDQLISAINNINALLSQPISDGICASVTIKILQRAVVTRIAFEATLTLNNNDNLPLTGFNVTLLITPVGSVTVKNDLFVILNPTVTGASDSSVSNGVLSMATVPGNGELKAQWLIRPLRAAAYSNRTDYRVGGVISYYQNGQRVEIDLIPSTISVLPEALLVLQYFLERTVYGDDPFTTQKETPIPFSLGLLVHNIGNGTAIDFQITSATPKIVDNEKGLLISFSILGTQVGLNNVDRSLTIEFGNIDAMSTSQARWLLISPLDGRFVEYNATYEALDDNGDPRLSLIDHVEIHGLLRMVYIDRLGMDDGLPDYLAVDTENANNLPDNVYSSSDLTPNNVRAVQSFIVSSVGDTDIVSLTSNSTHVIVTFRTDGINTFDPTGQSFVYFRFDNPLTRTSSGISNPASFVLIQMQRQNGSFVRTENAWTTTRTIHTTSGAVAQNYVHVFDSGNAGQYTATYILDPRVCSCYPGVSCINYNDTYSICGSCPAGFAGDGQTCVQTVQGIKF